MALMKVKGNIERLFDKNLNDLVRGIRNHKDDEGKYIASCLEEIKAELRQHNLSVKTNAVAKLTYLQVGTTRYCATGYRNNLSLPLRVHAKIGKMIL